MMYWLIQDSDLVVNSRFESLSEKLDIAVFIGEDYMPLGISVAGHVDIDSAKSTWPNPSQGCGGTRGTMWRYPLQFCICVQCGIRHAVRKIKFSESFVEEW